MFTVEVTHHQERSWDDPALIADSQASQSCGVSTVPAYMPGGTALRIHGRNHHNLGTKLHFVEMTRPRTPSQKAPFLASACCAVLLMIATSLIFSELANQIV